MDEKVAFVTRCVDEDERVARAAIADDCGQDGGFEDASWLDRNSLGQYNFGAAAAGMIRRVAVPRRMLAEVETKRRILDWCERAARILDEDEVWDIDASDVVEALAQPYAGQDGWREEWAL